MKRRATFYFLEGEDLPYCGVCWDIQNQAVQVFPSHFNNEGSAEWVCPSCKQQYAQACVRGMSSMQLDADVIPWPSARLRRCPGDSQQ